MGLLEQSLFQVNYRGPQMAGDKMFLIKEEQMDVEWLQQEAENWTQISHSGLPALVDAWGGAVPIKTTVFFANVDDPAKFTAQFIVTYAPAIPPQVPQVNLNLLYAATVLLISGIGQGIFFRELFNVSVAYLWIGIPTWAEETWTFAWTPGMGDGAAAGAWSYERAVEQYIKALVERGYISYL